jgi:hypothetical protein
VEQALLDLVDCDEEHASLRALLADDDRPRLPFRQ